MAAMNRCIATLIAKGVRRGSSGTGGAVAVMMIVVAFLPAACSKKSGEGNNLIILMVDTLRADHLGLHGYSRETSPDLDRFSRGATVFLSNFSQASRTGPSVASLFTSLHVRSHGVINPLERWDGKGVLDPARTTLAEILEKAGYSCRAVVSNPNVHGRYGFGQGFGTYLSVPLQTDAGLINGQAMRWLREREEGKPFFLYLHYMEPHSPYDPPSPARGRFSDPGYSGPITGDHLQLDAILRGDMTAGEADRQRISDLYDEEIYSWDREFGMFLGFLESQGLLENTVVMVTSDHGEEFFEHGGLLHGYTLYEEQLHVPLVIRAPDFEPRKISSVTRSVDVLPTMLELLGLEPAGGVQGMSLVPQMRGEAGGDLPVFAEAQMRAVKTVRSRSFRSKGWKYVETIVPRGRGPELFDLAADPWERKNRIDSNPDTANKIRRQMKEYLKGIPEVQGSSVILDREALELMRQMGYAGDGE